MPPYSRFNKTCLHAGSFLHNFSSPTVTVSPIWVTSLGWCFSIPVQPYFPLESHTIWILQHQPLFLATTYIFSFLAFFKDIYIQQNISQAALVRTPILLMTSYIIINKLLQLFLLQFPYHRYVDVYCIYFTGLLYQLSDI